MGAFLRRELGFLGEAGCERANPVCRAGIFEDAVEPVLGDGLLAEAGAGDGGDDGGGGVGVAAEEDDAFDGLAEIVGGMQAAIKGDGDGVVDVAGDAVVEVEGLCEFGGCGVAVEVLLDLGEMGTEFGVGDVGGEF